MYYNSYNNTNKVIIILILIIIIIIIIIRRDSNFGLILSPILWRTSDNCILQNPSRAFNFCNFSLTVPYGGEIWETYWIFSEMAIIKGYHSTWILDISNKTMKSWRFCAKAGTSNEGFYHQREGWAEKNGAKAKNPAILEKPKNERKHVTKNFSCVGESSLKAVSATLAIDSLSLRSCARSLPDRKHARYRFSIAQRLNALIFLSLFSSLASSSSPRVVALMRFFAWTNR